MRRAEPPPCLSLVICTLDESEAIGALLRETAAALSDLGHEILVVDDSADDRTAAVVRAFAAVNPAIRLIRRQGARGLASAAIAGWDAARGEALAIMDGDGQHDPALLPRLAARLAEDGADLAVASRYVAEGPSGLAPLRHLGSRAATLAACLALGARTTDPMSGFFVMTRPWYEASRSKLSGVGFKILADLMASGGRRPKVVELPASLRARAGGSSKLDIRVVAELAALLIEKRSGGAIPSRFTLFACVGATGLLVHLATLSATRGIIGAPFWLAQAMAILTAMTSNFFFNNALTFRDLRLKGRELGRGLMAFYLSCAGGAVIGEAAAAGLDRLGGHWIASGFAGAVLAALWNYWSASRAAWRIGGTTAAVEGEGRPVERPA
ncbi:MAG TPA: glycosyltransferase [Caulobacteraceae bacterium]|jgi:dolichol-phosphate mannosyltransferase|nr:glycosyltransferase [Caulobacteraceae bacterium]